VFQFIKTSPRHICIYRFVYMVVLVPPPKVVALVRSWAALLSFISTSPRVLAQLRKLTTNRRVVGRHTDTGTDTAPVSVCSDIDSGIPIAIAVSRIQWQNREWPVRHQYQVEVALSSAKLGSTIGAAGTFLLTPPARAPSLHSTRGEDEDLPLQRCRLLESCRGS